MSRENIIKFYEEVGKNEKLKKEFEKLTKQVEKGKETKEESLAKKIVSIAKENGFDFTKKELLSYMEEVKNSLSEEDLLNVSGGRMSARAAGIGLMGTLMLSFATGATFNLVGQNTGSISTQQEATLENENETPEGKKVDEDLSEELNNTGAPIKFTSGLGSDYISGAAPSGRNVTEESKLGRDLVAPEGETPTLNLSNEANNNTERNATAAPVVAQPEAKEQTKKAAQPEAAEEEQAAVIAAQPEAAEEEQAAVVAAQPQAAEEQNVEVEQETENATGTESDEENEDENATDIELDEENEDENVTDVESDEETEDEGIGDIIENEEQEVDYTGLSELFTNVIIKGIKKTNWFGKADLEVTISTDAETINVSKKLINEFAKKAKEEKNIDNGNIRSFNIKTENGQKIELKLDSEIENDPQLKDVLSISGSKITINNKLLEAETALNRAKKAYDEATNKVEELQKKQKNLENQKIIRYYYAIEEVDTNTFGFEWDLYVKVNGPVQIRDKNDENAFLLAAEARLEENYYNKRSGELSGSGFKFNKLRSLTVNGTLIARYGDKEIAAKDAKDGVATQKRPELSTDRILVGKYIDNIHSLNDAIDKQEKTKAELEEKEKQVEKLK